MSTYAYAVALHGKKINTVFASYNDVDEMRRSLINHDGYSSEITVRRERSKAKQVKGGAYMYTRAQYMAKECTFHEFYSQFVTAGIKQMVLSYIGDKEFLAKKYGEDNKLNNIPLAQWDRVGGAKEIFALSWEYEYSNLAPKDRHGKHYSLSSAVCILKTAAVMIVKGE